MSVLTGASEITAEHFPTPGLALRSNDVGVQSRVRGFAGLQVAAAGRVRGELLAGGWQGVGSGERVELLRGVYQRLVWWRYGIAAARVGAGSRHTAEHFVRPIGAGDTNYDRLGTVGRLREGATWDSSARTWVGGRETPASRVMVEMGELACARFDREAPDGNVVQNWVHLRGTGKRVRGNRLVRGVVARAVAEELLGRQRRRGNPVEGFDVGGELIYAATARQPTRARLHQAALEVLADADGDGCSWRAWCEAVYLLCQAPLTKKGSDAVNRTFAVGVGAVILGEPPRLVHDIDLRAMVLGQDAFTVHLTTINTPDR